MLFLVSLTRKINEISALSNVPKLSRTRGLEASIPGRCADRPVVVFTYPYILCPDRLSWWTWGAASCGFQGVAFFRMRRNCKTISVTNRGTVQLSQPNVTMRSVTGRRCEVGP